MTEVTLFDQWCIVELFGHQRYAGRIRCRPEPVHRWELPAAPSASPVIGYDIGGKLYDPADVTIIRRDDRTIEQMDLGDEPSPWDGVPL